jgi:hypothetical protein
MRHCLKAFEAGKRLPICIMCIKSGFCTSFYADTCFHIHAHEYFTQRGRCETCSGPSKNKTKKTLHVHPSQTHTHAHTHIPSHYHTQMTCIHTCVCVCTREYSCKRQTHKHTHTHTLQVLLKAVWRRVTQEDDREIRASDVVTALVVNRLAASCDVQRRRATAYGQNLLSCACVSHFGWLSQQRLEAHTHDSKDIWNLLAPYRNM